MFISKLNKDNTWEIKEIKRTKNLFKKKNIIIKKGLDFKQVIQWFTENGYKINEMISK